MAKSQTAWFVVHAKTDGFIRRKGDRRWEPYQAKKTQSFTHWTKTWDLGAEHLIFELDGWQFAVPTKKAKFMNPFTDAKSEARRSRLDDIRHQGRLNARFRKSRRRR